MGRRLIASDEAVPVYHQPTRPCSDCPWARAALPGWLGGASTDEWLQAAHGEARIACHALVGPQCAGAAIYRANVCKSVRDPSLLKLPTDRQAVFATPLEFAKHHATSAAEQDAAQTPDVTGLAKLPDRSLPTVAAKKPRAAERGSHAPRRRR